MSDPVKIIVTAETAQAAAALQQFVAQANSGLKSLVPAAAAGGSELTKLRQSSMALHEGFRTLSSSAFLLGGSRFPQLSMGIMGVTEGMRGLRSVALLTGASLSAMLLPIAAIAAVVGTGAFIWHEFSAGEAEAAKAAKDLEDSLGKIPGLLKDINTLQKAGRLGPGSAGEFSDYITGKKKLYKNSLGELTQSPTEQVETPIFYAPAPGVSVQTGTQMVTRNLKEASMSETQAWVEKQLGGEAGLKDAREQSIAELRTLEEKARLEALDGIAKEKAEIHDRYQKQRDEIAETMVAAGPLLTPSKRAAGEAALANLTKGENKDIAAVDTKADLEVQKAYNEMLREEYEWEKENIRLLGEDKKKALDEVTAAQQKQRDELMEQKIAVQTDPTLTQQEKAAQLEPILRAQKAIAATERERVQYERELAQLLNKQGNANFITTFKDGATQLSSQWSNLGATLANGSLKMITQGVNGIANALTSVIMGTKSAAQAFGEMGLSLITSFIEMILEAILWAEVAIPILTLLGVLSGGTTASTGATVTIAAIGSAMGAAGSVMAAAGGADIIPGQPYLVGEKGPELRVFDSGGSIIPAHTTASLLAGGGGGGGAGGASPISNKFIFVQDLKAAALEAMASPSGEKVTIVHVTKNKMKVGIRT